MDVMTLSAVGEVLRRWRGHRGMSQLDLATAAEVSQRHLSFVETGRSRPSVELLEHLGRHLALPLRAQNDLLLAAGFAPRHRARALDDAAMAPLQGALGQLLDHHEPYPAVVIDHGYDLLAANRGAATLLAAVAPDVAVEGLNLVELTLDEAGLASACLNLTEVAGSMVRRLERDRLLRPGDTRLEALWARAAEVADRQPPAEAPPDVAVPVRLTSPLGDLALFTMLVTVGSAADITADELSVELFYPMDDATADRLAQLSAPTSGL